MLSSSRNNYSNNNNVVNNTFSIPHVQLIPYSSFHNSHPLPLINQNIFLHHHYQDQLPPHQLVEPSLLCRATTAAALGSNNIPPPDEIAVASANTGAISSIPSERPRGAPPLRKDRHSKIYTAQGLRDRRVRLSIDISRQFFNLQDMLGFDKASQTLGWLLKNSKKAIKELARSKNKSSSSLASVSASGKEEEEKEDDDDDDKLNNMLCGESSVTEENEMASSKSSTTKEARSKARVRATERTKVKISNTTNQFRAQQQQNQAVSHDNNNTNSTRTTQAAASNNDEVEGIMVDQQSYVMRSKKIMTNHHPITSILGYNQQNLAAFSTSKDFIGSYSNPEPVLPSMPQNWDANGVIHPCTETLSSSWKTMGLPEQQ